METSSNPSMKPEVTSKKISNRRAKTKHTPILQENSDSSNHAGVNTTYHNNRFIKECYLFHQLIMKKYNLTHHIHDYTDEELFSRLE